MSMPSARRTIRLIDGRAPGRPFITAELYREFPARGIDSIESAWAAAREQAALGKASTGMSPLEHAHWDWRNKAGGIEAGIYMVVAVTVGLEAQGLMSIKRQPQAARLFEGHVVYVDYLESAPWNLKVFAEEPRYIGVGTALMVESIRISLESGLGGRVGLHSLPQAEAFYSRRRMSRVGPDPGYYGLTYFEYTEHQAAEWLASIGETP